MAGQAVVKTDNATAIVRMANPVAGQMFDHVFTRYPGEEWATFARFGWRDTPDGLVVTLAALDLPGPGELDPRVGHVAFQEPYTLRVALSAAEHPFALGVIHSHPDGFRTYASSVDDEMDSYYSGYFADFAPGRPYISLIFARRHGSVRGTGRMFWRGRWHQVRRFLTDHPRVDVDGVTSIELAQSRAQRIGRVQRLASAFGEEAADRLHEACVGVVGAGGTGSPAIEVLARAGVGKIISVDHDRFTGSNLERVHGSEDRDVDSEPAKVAIAKRHVTSINPNCTVVALRGRLPQPAIVDALVHADVVLGCTDQQHGRLALSDLVTRYLVPAFDVGVSLEGADGKVTGQVIQLVRFMPEDACALCRRMISSFRVSQELMSEGERRQRRDAAREARQRGENPNAYWHEEAQLNTVGYLTTAAGALAAGFVVGMVTGRFAAGFRRLQMNLSAEWFDVTDVDHSPRPECVCRSAMGSADQGAADAMITAPTHWPAVESVG